MVSRQPGSELTLLEHKNTRSRRFEICMATWGRCRRKSSKMPSDYTCMESLAPARQFGSCLKHSSKGIARRYLPRSQVVQGSSRESTHLPGTDHGDLSWWR